MSEAQPRADPPSLAGHLGCIYLVLPDESEQPFLVAAAEPEVVSALRKVAAALERDARVVAVRMPESTEADSVSFLSYEGLGEPDPMLIHRVSKDAPAVWDPMRVEVRVPKKNQPDFGYEEPPSESYVIRWNGSFLVVCYELPLKRPMAGSGHIVKEIISEAVEAAGFKAVVAGPTFAHTDLRIFRSDGSEAGVKRWDEYEVQIAVPIDGADPNTLVDFVFYECKRQAEGFYRATNIATHINFVDDILGKTSSELLLLEQRRARLDPTHLREWVRGRWALRGWRRRARELMAQMWLAMSVLHELRQQWNEANSQLLDGAQALGGVSLFEVDHTSDTREVEAVDMTFPRQALDFVSRRLDNRDLVWATLLGTVGGAVAGFLVAHL